MRMVTTASGGSRELTPVVNSSSTRAQPCDNGGIEASLIRRTDTVLLKPKSIGI